MKQIPVSSIKIPDYHVRENYRNIEELKNSLEKLLVYPILVRPIKDGFEVVVGSRRLKAYQLMGKESLEVGREVLVAEYNDVDAHMVSAVENLQRDNLTAFEKGKWVKQMMEQHGFTLANLAREIGVSFSAVMHWRDAYDVSLIIDEPSRRSQQKQISNTYHRSNDVKQVDSKNMSASMLHALKKFPHSQIPVLARIIQTHNLTRDKTRAFLKAVKNQPHTDLEELVNQFTGLYIELRLPLTLEDSVKQYAEQENLTIQAASTTLIHKGLVSEGLLNNHV